MNQIWLKTKHGFKSMSVPNGNLLDFTSKKRWVGHSSSANDADMLVEYSSDKAGMLDGFGNFNG